jgi:hypothetical protein
MKLLAECAIAEPGIRVDDIVQATIHKVEELQVLSPVAPAVRAWLFMFTRCLNSEPAAPDAHHATCRRLPEIVVHL